MPNKTIYVAEDDLPLYDRAQELSGGNLSSAVAHALRRFVEVEDARRAGLQEITVTVGTPGERSLKSFWGRQIARWFEPDREAHRIVILVVYKTRKGQYAVHRRESAARHPWWIDPATWTDPSVRKEVDEDGASSTHPHPRSRHPWWGDPSAWAGPWPDRRRLKEIMGWDRSTASLEVYADLEGLKAEVPEDLWRMVAEAEGEPPLEVLDI